MEKRKKKSTHKKNLVIVESPSKAKTIGKFLGSSYKVVASVGHIRDLPKSRMGIDIENDFEPQYINIRGKGDIIKELKKEAKNAKNIFLATDPDREGEAISWHIAHILDIDLDSLCRVEFYEITKDAVKKAIKNPRKLDLTRVDAQQARRVLDRIVGYSISPILWKKVKPYLSAGRVQSAALKMICDREDEINSFVSEEYWTIDAILQSQNVAKGKTSKENINATLIKKSNKKIEIKDENEAANIIEELKEGSFVVVDKKEKNRKKNPLPPYTTSTLQQDSSNKLGFASRKTMQIAQQLYEGINIKGHGTVGIISYIRTDSVRLSNEAREAAKGYITSNFGAQYYKGTVYGNKKKQAQDAHEAIRPSNVELSPINIKDSLTSDQFKLYNLIWNRFLASQMESAEYKGLVIDVKNNKYLFRANGQKLLFDGFLKIYSYDDEKDNVLPEVSVDDELMSKSFEPKQHFTKPAARYTEASLVKALEEENIGRPSTYAPIVATLMDRRYIKKDKKSLIPTVLGFTVTKLLEEYFTEIVDVKFTADIEDKIDEVGVSIADWKDIIRNFYFSFEAHIEKANNEIEAIKQEDVVTDIDCELCGKKMVIKSGRYGEFLACQGYPECQNTKPIVHEIGIKCPKCGNELLEKKSRRGKIFYGCSNYPECDNSYWDRPIEKKCPECGELLTEKNTKKGRMLKCLNKDCSYKEKMEE
ncbi:MAG: type I DNA topoisomerase [Eubacteriales bacterium]|nr:type I DNA topoisomerase [Eubacteriales bacterium]MDY3332656.1 type I DNA topoisomerase [Gallibacter sp.]